MTFPGRPYRARAAIVRQIPNDHGFTVQLDVSIQLRPAQMLVEPCAGIRETLEHAIRDAFQAFAANSFHVLLAALFDHPSDQAHAEAWTIGAQERKVTLGNLGVRGTLPDGFAGSVFEPFCSLLKSSALTPGLHWIRRFNLDLKGKTQTCEALCDNQPWDDLAAATKQLAWPRGADFYSVRLFLIVQGGIGVGDAIEVFCRSPFRRLPFYTIRRPERSRK